MAMNVVDIANNPSTHEDARVAAEARPHHN
jgi:hypothetical protein